MIRKLLTALAFLAALPGPVAADTAATSAILRPYHGKLTTREEAGRTVVSLRGVITPDLAADFKEALDKARPARPLTVDLDSPGGFTRAGYTIIDAMLRERAKGRDISTLVRRNARCESMCVGLFMAGGHRLAEPGARFMVHAPRSDSTGTISMRATREMIGRLVSLGVSQDWIRNVSAKGAFSGSHDFYRSAEELAADGSNIVTLLVAGN